MWNMLNFAEQAQIQKYKTHAYKTLKTVGVQIIMLKHLSIKKYTHKTHIPYSRCPNNHAETSKHKKVYPLNPYTNIHKNNPNHTN